MIRPPGWSGVAFSEKTDGDIRADAAARRRASDGLGLAAEWAESSQVHGNEVARVYAPGQAGEADALWTTVTGLPIAVFTADCFGVVLLAEDAVGVAHAGWRGAVSGVVTRLMAEMTSADHAPRRAAVGPGIGPCCFEVGPEVAGRFNEHVTETTWGTTSVDLPGVVAGQLEGLEVWSSGACTLHDDGWFSHRADGTSRRLASIGWVR